MAIFATRRRWEVTSLCAASISSWSRHRLESESSSSGDSIGNLRISWRYRERLPSGATLITAEATERSFGRQLGPCPTQCGARVGLECDWQQSGCREGHHVPETRP